MARARWEVSEAESVAKKDKLALLEAQHAAGNKSNENRGRGAQPFPADGSASDLDIMEVTAKSLLS